MLHEAHVGKYRRKGQWSSKRVAERSFLFSMQLQRTIFEDGSRNVSSYATSSTATSLLTRVAG